MTTDVTFLIVTFKSRESIHRCINLIAKKYPILVIENSADEFGSDAAYQIDSVFDWLRENPIDSHLVIEAFKKYKNENQKLFTPQICNLILKSADKIANSFSGKNKSELIFITQLHTILLKK